VNDQEIAPDEVHQYATDTRLEAADRWLEPLVERLEEYAAGGQEVSEQDRAELNEIVRVLKAWDRRADLDSQGGALFACIMFDDRLPAALGDEQPDAVAKAALQRAAEVRKQHKTLDVAWREFSRIRRGDIEMGVSGFGARTDRLSPFVALRPSYGALMGARHYCLGGSSYGMLVDFSNGVRAVSCLPFGVSDDPKSKHFADQLPLYVERQFKPAWFEANEILAHAESNVVLDAKATN
jgi:acyl-homoserine lactone acylase PvdQ